VAKEAHLIALWERFEGLLLLGEDAPNRDCERDLPRLECDLLLPGDRADAWLTFRHAEMCAFTLAAAVASQYF
jgi:hypothetical protein